MMKAISARPNSQNQARVSTSTDIHSENAAPEQAVFADLREEAFAQTGLHTLIHNSPRLAAQGSQVKSAFAVPTQKYAEKGNTRTASQHTGSVDVQPRQEQYPAHEAWHVIQRKQASGNTPHQNGNVIQAKFDRKSVHEALTVATGPAVNMGGTTGGAYNVKTGVDDPDRARLVVKVSGSSASVLASDLGIEIGIATPRSVMVPAEPLVLGNLKRVDSTLGNALGSQTEFEVQQHASLGTIPHKGDFSGLNSGLVLGRIAVFDALTGNHDRIYSINRENVVGNIAIDNMAKNETREATDMMEKVIAALATANGTLIAYVKNQIGTFNRQSYSGSPVSERRGLLVQLEMLKQAQTIKEKSGALKDLINLYNATEDEHTQATIKELKRLLLLEEPDMSSPLEQVIKKVALDVGRTREKIIESNIGTMTDKLGKPHFPELVKRLSIIESIDFSEAISAVEKAIFVIESTIEEQHQEKLVAWENKKKVALTNAKDAWTKKFWKFYTTEENYIGELMTTWQNSNPKPLPVTL
jgi:hypothetical protein